MSGERYTLTVEIPEVAGIPPIARLKAALKLLLRAFRIRCVEIREADANSRVLPKNAPDSGAVSSGASGQNINAPG